MHEGKKSVLTLTLLTDSVHDGVFAVEMLTFQMSYEYKKHGKRLTVLNPVSRVSGVTVAHCLGKKITPHASFSRCFSAMGVFFFSIGYVRMFVLFLFSYSKNSSSLWSCILHGRDGQRNQYFSSGK